MHIRMAQFRHRRLLYFRQIKHMLCLRRLNLRAITLSYIQQQQPYLSLDQLQEMTAEQRAELRQRNPEFPPTLFMTEEEKEDFFQQKGEIFMQALEGSASRHCKTKKIVKFIGKVEHFYDPNSQILENFEWA